MLKQSALEFGRALADLRLMAMLCGNSVNFNLSEKQLHETKLALQDTIGNLLRVAILSDMNDAIGPELERFQDALKVESMQQLSSRADHLRTRILDDLVSEWFFQVDKFEVRYYDRPDLFGPGVTQTFPGASADIRNAKLTGLLKRLSIATTISSQRMASSSLPPTHRSSSIFYWSAPTGSIQTASFWLRLSLQR